jgi:hypothetical protein
MSEEKRPGGPLEDEPPTAEEEAAATALRRALEEGEAAGPARAEAEAGAFLAFSRDAGALAPGRAAAVLRRVLDATPVAPAPVPVRQRPARRPWRWALPAAACAAAAALLLALSLRTPKVGLPPPPRALLHAQLAAARGGPVAAPALEREMRAYRERLYATLGHRYPRNR